MTETREQFRERIGRFAADWDGGDWEMMMPEDREMYASQAAAVYAQALRDVLALARTDELGWQKVRLIQEVQVHNFAAERGIDLETQS